MRMGVAWPQFVELIALPMIYMAWVTPLPWA
jgi:hypothetical protein